CAVREKEKAPLEAGMVITNEPGLYIEGSHGIRTENELVIRKGPKTEYGQFLYFEPITYVPIDLDAVKPDMMRQEDKEQLNAYHAKVYELVSPHLNDEEREWLKEYTRNI
ncbi:MAG: M24 family metallopeptidase, partial [Clostridia bacterium]|nr:M24 family metallopeptidase [Clostridia bacterium]